MILTIAAIEDSQRLDYIQRRLAALEWRDGRATAGRAARRVKRNQQANMHDPVGQELHAAIMELIADHPVIKAAARPRRFTRLMISKTHDGGHYGPHVDNAFMDAPTYGGGARLRSDLSFTLFLTPPQDYDGGELVVHSNSMAQRIKGEAGQLVLYPSSNIHEVTPVTRGERIVCVGWIESLVADPTQRELLFDLENLRVSLRQSLPADALELLMLDKSIANLLRMWGAA
jgi:PKHD-type hydroxylase